LQTQSLNRRQTAATDKEADGYTRSRPAAAGAPGHTVEVNSTAAFAAEEDTATEGFPQPLGHPGPTTDIAAVEAVTSPLATTSDTLEAIG